MTARPTHSRRFARIAVQLVGFSVGMALLVWAVRLALNEDNRGQFQRLAEAPPLHVIGLIGLSIATIVLNGMIFHRTLVPVRRLRTLDVVAVNAIATLLNYLPFKLSIISRVLIHNRRDGLPLGQIAGWLAAVGVGGVISFGPVAVVGLWRGTIDAVLAPSVTFPLQRTCPGPLPVASPLSIQPTMLTTAVSLLVFFPNSRKAIARQ